MLIAHRRSSSVAIGGLLLLLVVVAALSPALVFAQDCKKCFDGSCQWVLKNKRLETHCERSREAAEARRQKKAAQFSEACAKHGMKISCDHARRYSIAKVVCRACLDLGDCIDSVPLNVGFSQVQRARSWAAKQAKQIMVGDFVGSAHGQARKAAGKFVQAVWQATKSSRSAYNVLSKASRAIQGRARELHVAECAEKGVMKELDQMNRELDAAQGYRSSLDSGVRARLDAAAKVTASSDESDNVVLERFARWIGARGAALGVTQ